MKKFIKYLLCLIFLLSNTFVFAQKQEKEPFPSKEEMQYYDSLSKQNDYFFKLIEKDTILKFHSNCFEIKECVDFEPYDIEKEYQRMNDFFDLARQVETDTANFEKNAMVFYSDTIGKVWRHSVLLSDTLNYCVAMIYENYDYAGIFNPNIWVAFSKDLGKNWNYYYTDITQMQPIFVKFYSKIPLILNDSILQIETALLQQTAPFSMPANNAQFECVKDGIYLEFNINKLAQDSDNDGLTDIEENKLYLNPQSNDTDGDGILDNVDLNPRVNFPRTEMSKVFEVLLNQCPKDSVKKYVENYKDFYSDTEEENLKPQTYLIVTDNQDLMGIQPTKDRIIFVSEKEYKELKDNFNTNLKSIYVSPLFKVDRRKNMYKVSVDYGFHGTYYVIKKIKNKWKIKVLYSIIV